MTLAPAVPSWGDLLPGPEAISAVAVCAAVGISYRQLDYWARTNLVRPSITEAGGSGTQRRYSKTDVVRLALVKQLLDAGVSLQTARLAMQRLPDRNPDGKYSWILIADRQVVVGSAADMFVQLLERRLALVCHLDAVAADIAETLGGRQT